MLVIYLQAAAYTAAFLHLTLSRMARMLVLHRKNWRVDAGAAPCEQT